MNEYHKIYNIYKRDVLTNCLIKGNYYDPYVEFLKNLDWVATEKVDGTNIRIQWNGKELKFGGKTDNAQLHAGLVKRLNDLFEDKKELFAEKFGEYPVCLYGEGYGAGIQTGGCYKNEKDFVLFDVWINGNWLNRGEVEGIAQMMGLEMVPIVKIAPLEELVKVVEGGLKSSWGDFIAEGVVARPMFELKNKFGERLIVKIKARDLASLKEI